MPLLFICLITVIYVTYNFDVFFSDPNFKQKIAEKITELKSSNNKTVLIGEINALLTERNSKAKILK